MPTKFRKPKHRISDLGDVTRRYLLDELTFDEALALLRPKGTQFEYIHEAWTFQSMFWRAEACSVTEKEIWRRHRDELLTEFIEHNPGQRPSCWWRYDETRRPEDGESQAEFLKRHGLLMPGEEKRLAEGTERKAETICQ